MAIFPKRSAERTPWSGCLLLVLLLVLAGVGGTALWLLWPQRSGLDPRAEPRPVVARGSLSEFEKVNIEIYEKASPSLAQVTNLGLCSLRLSDQRFLVYRLLAASMTALDASKMGMTLR